MRELRASLAAATTLVASAAAQVNPFVFYPQDPERQTVTCTSFVGRPDVNRAAEGLVELNDQWFRGVGEFMVAGGLIFGVYHWVADERLATTETYDLVVRMPAPGGGPDPTPFGELLRIRGLTTPPSSNPNRGTWIMYDGFGIPGGMPTTMGTWFVGVSLPANNLWPATDGHALFRADMLNANTGATLGENHRLGAPSPTWAIPSGGAPFTTPWTYILGPFVTSSNLHVGGIDPTSTRLGAPGASLGMNGLFPDIRGNPRRDGLMLRFTDNLTPFAWAFLGASLGFQPAVPAGIGVLSFSHIGGPGGGAVTVGLVQLQNGERDVPLAMPGTIPLVLAGTRLAFQGVVFDPNSGLASWSNAQQVHF
jgi:hypothetical protein